MAKLLNYFAYGSNLHPLRLKLRVPSSQALGIATLPGHALYFHKPGRDGSGKCNVLPTHYAAEVIGVVYQIHAQEKTLLDQAEGLGFGYEIATASVAVADSMHTVFFYQAALANTNNALRPYTWYKQLVVEGARFHQLPAEYIASLEQIEALSDPDPNRTATHQKILQGTIA